MKIFFLLFYIFFSTFCQPFHELWKDLDDFIALFGGELWKDFVGFVILLADKTLKDFIDFVVLFVFIFNGFLIL